MTTKEELIDEIEGIADELIDYMRDLRNEAEDAVDEAQDTDTTLERLQEIRSALFDAAQNQWTGLRY